MNTQTTKPHIPVLDHGYVKLVDHMGNDLSPCEDARMSTDNPTGVDEKADDGLRGFMLSHQHTSPFEGCILKIEVQAPIFVFRQWHRHRTMSYSEFSGRYSELPDMVWEPSPDRVELQSPINHQGGLGVVAPEIAAEWLHRLDRDYKQTRETYEWALSQGISKELARIDLPVRLYTKMRATANLLNWFRFLKLRMDGHAQKEIQAYANAAFTIIQGLWPKCAAEFEEHWLYAVTLSRTEMMALWEIMREWHLVPSVHETEPPTVGAGLRRWLAEADMGLSARQQSEFLAKIGVG